MTVGHIEIAIEWLATFLSTGPKTERQFRESRPAHLSTHARDCAKKRLGVVMYRRDWRNWIALPTDPSIPANEKESHT